MFQCESALLTELIQQLSLGSVCLHDVTGAPVACE